MSEKVMEMDERINPAYITDNDTGIKYELDFSRDSVRFAEAHEFLLEDLFKYPQSKVKEFFFYAFRKNHRSIPREKTDKLLDKWGGMPQALLSRLVQLYQQAQMSNAIQTDEDAEKNASVTLEL